MFRSIAHIGVAVRNLEESAELFRKLFGQQTSDEEEIADQRVKTAMFRFGGTSIELLEATSPDSSIARFLDKKGEGVHHISFVVEDIAKELQRLKGLGFQLIDETPRQGAGRSLVAFLHPKSTNGVLVEISQKG